MLRISLFVCLLFLSGSGYAQYGLDSLRTDNASAEHFGYQRATFEPRELIVPGGLIVAGTALNFKPLKKVKSNVVTVRNRYTPKFRTYVDDYLQFSPIVAAYSLDLFGVQSKTDFVNRSAILLKGEVALIGITCLIKYTAGYDRPDHSNRNSFPSGHTAQAFAAATFLSEEYKDRLPWIPYAGYGVASSVGILRMANNKHYLSDVLAGAGIGILSMKVSYWTHKYKWNKKKQNEYKAF